MSIDREEGGQTRQLSKQPEMSMAGAEKSMVWGPRWLSGLLMVSDDADIGTKKMFVHKLFQSII